MTLEFPNDSRSFDSRHNVIRFWGYDDALEVPFFVDVSAICRLDLRSPDMEANCLAQFDAAVGRIRKAARKTYRRGRKGSYHLTADDLAAAGGATD